jgi:hypothetical protein
VPTTATPFIMSDPGYLFWAPGDTVVPTMTAAASKFTDAWPVAWINLGATEEGSELSFSTSVEPIRVAEIFNPINYSVVEQSSSMSFSLADYTLKNLQRAWNGIAPVTVSGTGATLVSALDPPLPSEIVRCAIGWESLDGTMRMIAQRTINGSEITSAFRRAPDKALIPCQFQFEIPTGGTRPFRFYAAGTARLGV